MTQFLNQTLWEYPQKVVGGSVDRVLDSMMDRYRGVLPLAPRFAGRSFCTPGERLRLRRSDLRPSCLGDVGLDEDWICCTTPIVTGCKDTRTGEVPFREGEAHVITPAGHLVSLQELIEEGGARVIGPRHLKFTTEEFGRPTWGIVSKKFDNRYPIPHHLHWKKWEVYDINEFDNPGVHPSHHHTTAMGLYPWVHAGELYPCFSDFDGEEYNGIRHLSPHTLMRIGHGFCMPAGVLHAPTNLVHHEVHVLMDEHFLAENLTRDGRIPSDVAFLACRPEDYPLEFHKDWDYLVSKIDLRANQDPSFVLRNSRPPTIEQNSNGEFELKWIVYSPFGGTSCSIARITVPPKESTPIPLPSPAVFHLNQGMARINGQTFEHQKMLQLGKLCRERGFITHEALDSQGGAIQVANTGEEPLVLTLDFPQGVRSPAVLA